MLTSSRSKIKPRTVKGKARTAASSASNTLRNTAPTSVAACIRPPTALELHSAATEARREAAKKVFPGKQHYQNCGVQSAAQVVAQATGKPIDEDAFLKNAIEQGYAQRSDGSYACGPISLDDLKKRPAPGGTSPRTIQQILQTNGVEASIQSVTAKNLKDAILERKGIIATVEVSELWKPTSQTGGHAVVVTDGIFDKQGNLTGVIINDTGTGQQGRVLGLKDFLDAAYALDGQKLITTNGSIWP